MTLDTPMGKDHWCLSLSAHPLGSRQSTLEWSMAEEKVQGTLCSSRKRTGAKRCICSDGHMYRSSSFLLFLQKEKKEYNVLTALPPNLRKKNFVFHNVQEKLYQWNVQLETLINI